PIRAENARRHHDRSEISPTSSHKTRKSARGYINRIKIGPNDWCSALFRPDRTEIGPTALTAARGPAPAALLGRDRPGPAALHGRDRPGPAALHGRDRPGPAALRGRDGPAAAARGGGIVPDAP